MRLNSTFKASCYALALSIFSFISLKSSAQVCTKPVRCPNIEITFESPTGTGGSWSGFSSNDFTLSGPSNNNSKSDYDLESTSIRNGLVKKLLSPTFTAPRNGSIDYRFELSGSILVSSYQVYIVTATDSTLLCTDVPVYLNNGPATICGSALFNPAFGGKDFHFTFIFTVVTNNQGNQTFEFDDFGSNVIAEAVLPVNFRGVSATKSAKGVQVKWDVFEEIDVKEYQVERITNGTTFTKIGSVEANGAPSYYFADAAPATGVNIYRIKSVDIDGKFKYSTIARINLSNAISLKAFPLPAADAVTIEHGIGARGTLQLSTADGRAIKAKTVAEGTSQTTLDLNGLQRGLYLVRFVKENGSTETLKIIKQ